MITKALISEINALAKKQKTVGLTSEEKEKQAQLRKVYLHSMRSRVTQQLSRIHFRD